MSFSKQSEEFIKINCNNRNCTREELIKLMREKLELEGVKDIVDQFSDRHIVNITLLRSAIEEGLVNDEQFDKITNDLKELIEKSEE